MSEERPRYRNDTAVEETATEWVLKSVPKLFEWLEWLALLGAIGYVAKTHQSPALSAVVMAGNIALGVYFGALCGNRFPQMPLFNSSKSHVRFVGYVAGVGIGLFICLFSGFVVDALVKHGGA